MEKSCIFIFRIPPQYFCRFSPPEESPQVLVFKRFTAVRCVGLLVTHVMPPHRCVSSPCPGVAIRWGLCPHPYDNHFSRGNVKSKVFNISGTGILCMLVFYVGSVGDVARRLRRRSPTAQPTHLAAVGGSCRHALTRLMIGILRGRPIFVANRKRSALRGSHQVRAGRGARPFGLLCALGPASAWRRA